MIIKYVHAMYYQYTCIIVINFIVTGCIMLTQFCCMLLIVLLHEQVAYASVMCRVVSIHQCYVETNAYVDNQLVFQLLHLDEHEPTTVSYFKTTKYQIH